MSESAGGRSLGGVISSEESGTEGERAGGAEDVRRGGGRERGGGIEERRTPVDTTSTESPSREPTPSVMIGMAAMGLWGAASGRGVASGGDDPAAVHGGRLLVAGGRGGGGTTSPGSSSRSTSSGMTSPSPASSRSLGAGGSLTSPPPAIVRGEPGRWLVRTERSPRARRRRWPSIRGETPRSRPPFERPARG